VGICLVNFIMTVVIMPMTRRHESALKNLRNDLFGHLRNMVNGLRELSFKKNLRRAYVNRLIEPTIENQNEIKLKNTLVINSIAKVEMVLMMGALAFGVYFAHRSTAFESTEFMAFLALALFLIAPMTKINSFLRVMNKTSVALEQIDELGIGLRKVKGPKHQPILHDQWNHHDPILSFSQVEHTYVLEDIHDSFTLGPLDLEVMENETVFIIGGNGSGKTTLIQLLTGLYDLSSGSITYKNVTITESLMDDYQNRFAALFVNDFVFKILYHIDEKAVNKYGQRYLDLLDLSEKVSIIDHEFSTINLSYGQRKRLNLVMAMLEDKEIYVFDEWAANQDPYFKSIFYNQVLGGLKSRGKTVFVISHDDSYFDVADRIVKLEDGKIVANYLQNKG
jgi:putative ATP-binding cassette transporter